MPLTPPDSKNQTELARHVGMVKEIQRYERSMIRIRRLKDTLSDFSDKNVKHVFISTVLDEDIMYMKGALILKHNKEYWSVYRNGKVIDSQIVDEKWEPLETELISLGYREI